MQNLRLTRASKTHLGMRIGPCGPSLAVIAKSSSIVLGKDLNLAAVAFSSFIIDRAVET